MSKPTTLPLLRRAPRRAPRAGSLGARPESRRSPRETFAFRKEGICWGGIDEESVCLKSWERYCLFVQLRSAGAGQVVGVPVDQGAAGKQGDNRPEGKEEAEGHGRLAAGGNALARHDQRPHERPGDQR